MNERLWAIVPVKPFRHAKSRLAAVLTGEQRAGLSRDFLGHTLSVLGQVPAVAQTLVVSRDPAALDVARNLGALAFAENGRYGLNAALECATQVALVDGAGAVLILPTDLPCLEPGDIRQLIKAARDGPCVVIAPDRHERGTNALFVRPPGSIAYSFGDGSFARHQALAEKAGARLRICRLPGTALDVDVPDDWALYQAARKA